MPVFPPVASLDPLLRNEHPLSNGGKWKKTQWAAHIGEDTTPGGWGAEDTFPGGEDSAYWSVKQYTEPGYAMELLTGAEVIERYIALFCCLRSPGTEKTGYEVRWEAESGPSYLVYLIRWDKGVKTVLGTSAKRELVAKDLLGISVEAGKVIAWRKAGAGAMAVVFEVADAEYTTGFVGFGARGTFPHVAKAEVGEQVLHAHTLEAGQKQTPGYQRALARTLKPSQPAKSSALASALARQLAASQTQVPSLGRSATRTLALGQAQLAVRSGRIAHALGASQAQTATPVRGVARLLLTTQLQSGLMLRDVTRVLALGQGQSAVLNQPVGSFYGVQEMAIAASGGTAILSRVDSPLSQTARVE